MISDCIYDNISPQTENLNIIIPTLLYFNNIDLRKTQYFASNASFVSDIKLLS